jgi:hypothetical protein
MYQSRLMPERVIKIDSEIWAIEQKLKEVLAPEKHEALTAQVAELKKQREALVAEMDKKSRERLQ